MQCDSKWTRSGNHSKYIPRKVKAVNWVALGDKLRVISNTIISWMTLKDNYIPVNYPDSYMIKQGRHWGGGAVGAFAPPPDF